MSIIGDLPPWDFPNEWDKLTLANVEVPGLVKVTGWKRAITYDVKVGKGTGGATITLGGKPPAKGSIEFRVWNTAQLQAWDAQVRPLLSFTPHPQATATTPTNGTTSRGDQLTTSGGADATTGGGTVNNPAASATPAKGSSEDAYSAPAQPKSLTKADALDIFHPILAELEVTAVLPPEELGQWENSDDGGVGFMRRTIEFLEFKPPTGNITATPQGSTSDGAAARGDKYSVGGADANGGTSPTSPGNASGSASDARGATVPPSFGGKKP